MKNSQLETLREQRPRIEAEIQAVNDVVAQQKVRLDNVNEHLADLNSLFNKGYSRKDVLINQRIEQALVEAERSRLQGELAHLRQTMGDLDFKIEELNVGYARQTLSELQETSQRLREIEAAIGPARRIRDVRADYANSQGSEADCTILISRTSGGDMATIKATSETILEPGDVVEVKLNRRDPFVPSTEAALSVGDASIAAGAQPERK
jgi:hypothetical protein